MLSSANVARWSLHFIIINDREPVKKFAIWRNHKVIGYCEITEKARQKNIAELQPMLDEARALYAEIPDRHDDLETIREREVVFRRIKELSALIADEQKAIEELDGASDADIEGIVAEMGI